MDVLQVFGQIFAFLGSFNLFGIPYIYIVLGIALIGIIMNFVKGERK